MSSNQIKMLAAARAPPGRHFGVGRGFGQAGSALGVAEEGADHTFLAAAPVAGAQGFVLAMAEPRSLAPAMGATGIGEIDR
jgi:hypothetical protein